MSATTWICKTMHVDHHHNKLEQKKVLNRLLSVEKLAIVFYLLYFVARWPFHDIIGGVLQFKSFSLLLRYEDLWAILLRGLLYNENNDWALSARLKFLSGLGVKVLSDLVHLYPMFWNNSSVLCFILYGSAFPLV